MLAAAIFPFGPLTIINNNNSDWLSHRHKQDFGSLVLSNEWQCEKVAAFHCLYLASSPSLSPLINCHFLGPIGQSRGASTPSSPTKAIMLIRAHHTGPKIHHNYYRWSLLCFGVIVHSALTAISTTSTTVQYRKKLYCVHSLIARHQTKKRENKSTLRCVWCSSLNPSSLHCPFTLTVCLCVPKSRLLLAPSRYWPVVCDVEN